MQGIILNYGIDLELKIFIYNTIKIGLSQLVSILKISFYLNKTVTFSKLNAGQMDIDI